MAVETVPGDPIVVGIGECTTHFRIPILVVGLRCSLDGHVTLDVDLAYLRLTCILVLGRSSIMQRCVSESPASSCAFVCLYDRRCMFVGAASRMVCWYQQLHVCPFQ